MLDTHYTLLGCSLCIKIIFVNFKSTLKLGVLIPLRFWEPLVKGFCFGNGVFLLKMVDLLNIHISSEGQFFD
jgi:hypothetical protein